MTTEARGCVFCGATSGLTREHLLPQWIWRDFGSPGQKLGTTTAPFKTKETWDLSTEPGHRTYEPDYSRAFVHPAARKAKLVCGTCNNGWMADLEGETQRIMHGLLDGDDDDWRSLDPDDRMTLRRWSQKTAVMFEQFDREVRLSGPATYAAVYRGVDPPGSWYSGIGRTQEVDEPWAGTTPLLLGRITDGAKQVNGPIYALQHVVTFGDLIVVIRHSNLPLGKKVRYDHDLYRHWAGSFVPLTEQRQERRRWRGRPIARLHPSSVNDIVQDWGHAIRPRESFLPLQEGDRRWIGLARHAKAHQIAAFMGLDPDGYDLVK